MAMTSPNLEASHPAFGGKTLESLQAAQNAPRAPYRSWRKKYRKMRTRFDQVLEDNKRIFREEQKLEDVARRLQEELDTMMEIMLEINQSPALPTALRYDISGDDEWHARAQPTQNVVDPGIPPDEANILMQRYKEAVQNGQLPSIELYFVREQIQERLAEQGVTTLSSLEQKLQQDTRPKQTQLREQISQHTKEVVPDGDATFLTAEHEDAYLAKTDAKLGRMDQVFDKPRDTDNSAHQAELTPRELERQLELINPQSQHNWLKTHPKVTALDPDYHEDGASKAAGKRRASGKVQAIKSEREGQSPSEASGHGWDDDYGPEEAQTHSGRKKFIDKDPTFRGKTGRGGSTKAKRKRATDEGAGGGKRIRAADVFD